jgi:hypothetical protein
VYHADCILRIFKISKGRLKRLQERIKREMRGEIARHGLYGRPSNNRKKLAPDDEMESPIMSTHHDGIGGRVSPGEARDHATGAAAVSGVATQDTDDDCDDLLSDHEDMVDTGVHSPLDRGCHCLHAATPGVIMHACIALLRMPFRGTSAHSPAQPCLFVRLVSLSPLVVVLKADSKCAVV